MNSGTEHSDEVSLKHIGDHKALSRGGSQSPVLIHMDTSPRSESSETSSEQNEDYQSAETHASSPQSPEAILCTHEPDDSPPQPGDKAQARGKVERHVAARRPLRRPEPLNVPTEAHTRGSNGPIAQAIAAGPTLRGPRNITPEPRVVTPPPPVAPMNE
ncbi:hypothetical protein FRC12_015233 [Ceratobasidium sp. 428]|nr:hypothetical protein FRC12_015233 [Ceratobasidium sp. 428]